MMSEVGLIMEYIMELDHSLNTNDLLNIFILVFQIKFDQMS